MANADKLKQEKVQFVRDLTTLAGELDSIRDKLRDAQDIYENKKWKPVALNPITDADLDGTPFTAAQFVDFMKVVVQINTVQDGGAVTAMPKIGEWTDNMRSRIPF